MRQTRDVARIAAALERPGIDPRTWSTLAIVTAVTVDKDGVHADITTVTGIEESATVAPIYAGDGFGFYLPIAVHDAVVVEFPEGDHNLGGRIIGRVWDQADPPPSDVVDHPGDVVLIVQPKKSLRMATSGGGDVVIEARDSGRVLLGAELGTKGVARLGDTVRFDDTAFDALQARLDLRYAQVPPNPGPPVLPRPLKGYTPPSPADPLIGTNLDVPIATASTKVEAS